MANDIQAAKNTQPVKNGTLITTTTFTGFYSKRDTYVSNSPTIADIQSKFDDRFDDPSYYYGIGASGILGT